MKAANLSFITALALGALIAIAPTSKAQDDKDSAKPSTPQAGRQRVRRAPGQAQFNRIASELKLSDDQKNQLRPIFQEENKKLQELRQDTTLTAKDRRDQVRKTREQYLAKIKEHLTPDQVEQFKKLRQEGARVPRQAAPSSKPESKPAAPAQTDKS